MAKQADLILMHMKKYGSITHLEAEKEYGIARLASRINDLRRQGVAQLRNLWRNHPDYWALLMKWDIDSPVTFKADGHTVHDFDRRFQMEIERKIPMDRTFRWAMLDNPPKFVADTSEQLSFRI